MDPPKIDVLEENIAGTGIEKIDYIISHHGEQDHSGSIAELARKYPEAEIITNEKCMGMLMDLLHIPEDRFRVSKRWGNAFPGR